MKRKNGRKAEARTRKFRLHIPGESKNPKDRTVSFLTDWLFLWLYLAGLFGWLAAAFRLPVAWAPYLCAQGAVALLATAVWRGLRRRRRLKLLLYAGALALLALGLRRFWESGIHILYNQITEGVGETFPYILPAYRVTVSGEMETAALYLALFWLAGLAALLGIYLVRSGNRILTGLQMLLVLAVKGIFSAPASQVWTFVPLLCLLALWLRSHGERIPEGRQRLAHLEAFGQAAALAVLLAAAGNAVLGQLPWPQEGVFAAGKAAVQTSLDRLRYSGESQILPEGDFTGLDSFEPQGMPVLEVTMSQPESYYLRGFTGSRYTGTGWEELDPAFLWQYRDLFYWLHEDGFYGQEGLATAAASLDETVAAAEKNVLSIQNLAGSSRYCYVPYELQSQAGSFLRETLDAQKIGDAGLLAGGLRGSRSYSYSALSNQVTQYPAYAARLLEPESLTDQEKEYLQNEEYYNAFVYAAYLEMPDTMRSALYQILGAVEIGEGEKHADYAEAKENILYALTSSCTNTNTLESPWEGTDLILDFLQVSREGYSVHFASAAAMMFRYYGIPARYVEGYLITPADTEAMTAGEPYVLDDTHAHAWVEYYQDGVGWLPFETTPSYLNVMGRADDFQDISGIASGAAGSQEEEPEENPEEEPEEDPEPVVDWLRILEILMIAAICLFLLILLSFFLWILVQRRKSRKAKKLFQSPDQRLAVRALFDSSMNILSVAGLAIQNRSLYSYQKPLSRLFDPELADAYKEVVRIRQEAVYSQHEITEEQREQVAAFRNRIWDRMYRQGGWVQRFQLKYVYFL